MKGADSFGSNHLIIFENYLYVVAKTGTGASAVTEIYKHAIGANGALSAAEFVLNWTASPFGSRTLRGLLFSSAGMMYIATDAEDPILSYDQATGEFDYLYKGILPAYVRDFHWGTGNYLYMTTGKTDVQDWIVYRVDMGTTSGSN